MPSTSSKTQQSTRYPMLLTTASAVIAELTISASPHTVIASLLDMTDHFAIMTFRPNAITRSRPLLKLPLTLSMMSSLVCPSKPASRQTPSKYFLTSSGVTVSSTPLFHFLRRPGLNDSIPVR